MKKLLCLLLSAAMALPPVLSAAEETAAERTGEAGKYVFRDAVSVLPAAWNPHTVQTDGDRRPLEFIQDTLYTFLYNDALHPIEGREPYSGYVIVPEMAAKEPVDVTERVRAEHPEFGIPESAEKGYAYAIDLNPDCVWEDGTPINADTYVYSMRRLLDPALGNCRAADWYAGEFSIAGAEAYAMAGRTVKADNGLCGGYTMENLVKDENGAYTAAEGFPVFLAADYPLDRTGGNTLRDYVDAYGEACFSMTNWETLAGMADENGLIPLTDESYALFAGVITGNPAWGETEADLPCYFIIEKTWPEADFESVGLYKSGEYQITLALSRPLTGFDLLRHLAVNSWIVKEDLYEACLTPDGDAFASAYNTGVETTCSCGPYRLADYEAGKGMRFVRNENWFGCKDGRHVYVDPGDGETYPFYMTDEIDVRAAAEAADRKRMFLEGLLTQYPLRTEDFAEYRNSDFLYFTPAETVYFLILNGCAEKLGEREAAEGFDPERFDLQTIALPDFRKAVSLSYDREDFAAAVSPARSGAYGLIGSVYLADPETGALYRHTDQAKRALCAAYGVNAEDCASLDEAAASITGFDPAAAKELYKAAFRDALDAGYITDHDGDGICDQTIRMEYAASSLSAFMEKTVACLNEKMAEATRGTPFDGKVEFCLSAPYGSAWADQIKQGLSDAALGGWSGNIFDPYALTDLFVNPSGAYNAQWFDPAEAELTISIDGEDLTASLKDWSGALNGVPVVIGEKEYGFGEGQADAETRLNILAAIETAILGTYDYLPMLQDASAHLLSQQVHYVAEEYSPIMDRGGLMYLKYNYDETNWREFVDSQPGGILRY